MKRLLAMTAVGLLVAVCSQAAVAADAKNNAPVKTDATVPAMPEAKKAGEAGRHAVDINSASADELRALPGLTADDAKKIVDHRPYKRKDDLIKKKILSQTIFDRIKNQVVAKHTTAKQK